VHFEGQQGFIYRYYIFHGKYKHPPTQTLCDFSLTAAIPSRKMVFLGLSCYKFWLFSNCQATTATTTTIITTSKFCCWQQTFVSQCIKFGDCMCMLQIICNQKFPATEIPSDVCVCGGGGRGSASSYLSHSLSVSLPLSLILGLIYNFVDSLRITIKILVLSAAYAKICPTHINFN